MSEGTTAFTVLPHMRAQRWGRVVNVSSGAARTGGSVGIHYSASKGGVVGMTLPLAREFARIGIRVNVIAPGIFMTPMVAGMTPELQASLGAQVPFPSRLGRPEEVAATVGFLFSEGASYITGQAISVNGGML